jgi:exopolyphosphatase/guanosine-5'-triphosphate,3'-diphosphate pyrophosphatase
MARRKLPDTLAAIDLGSNSFHMVVARVAAGQPEIIDRLREPVQVAEGLDRELNLSKKARRRALECLERFGQRIRDLAPQGVRAVGTNTLRIAKNSRDFLEAAEAALGHTIEIVSGWEEARLIYLGVSHTLAEDDGNRLVVDIGGGSTECILGRRFETLHARSLDMGCVSYSRRFFPDGVIRGKDLDDAVMAAHLNLRGEEEVFSGRHWSTAVGSSGTIRAVEQVLVANGERAGITREGLEWLAAEIVAAGHVKRLDFEGLKAERAPVLPGGVAILAALFERFEISELAVSRGAMRDGVLFDLLGRLQHEDVRDRTIRSFQDRFHVDEGQAQRVERTALELLAQVAKPWKLDSDEAARFLSWAARLHEIGLAVSFTGYAEHGAYLISNTDMPGFSRDDQALLALLIAAHRGKPKPRRRAFETPPGRARKMATRLTTLLRLAVRLHRGRSSLEPATPTLRLRDGILTLEFAKGWLAAHPMTRKDLEREAEQLAGLGVELHTVSEKKLTDSTNR